MAGLADAFKQSRRSLSGASATARGNLILQPTEFKDDTVVGKVISGAQAGNEIEVKYAGSLTKKDYTKKRGKSEVSIENGGTLRVEQVKEGKDGVYEARWMKTFNGNPNTDRHAVLPDAVCNFVWLQGRDKEDRPKMRVSQLMVDNETKVDSIEGLQSAIQEAFEAEGAVTLFGMDGKNVLQVPYFLSGKNVDGTWTANDPAEKAADVIESFGDSIEQVKAVLEDKGFSVVPTRSYAVGPTTAENIEREIEEAAEKGARARISTLDPQSWKCPTIGMRLQSALSQTGDNAVAEGTKDKLETAFKNYADKSEAEAFGSKGWRGLTNDTMTKFFESMGVELMEHPTEGWSTQALLEDKLEGMDRGFIVKGFPLKSTAPYPAVEACQEAREAYYTEMKDAAEAAVAGLRAEAGAGKTAEAQKADDAAPKDELPSDEGDALDDLLNSVADDEMDLNS